MKHPGNSKDPYFEREDSDIADNPGISQWHYDSSHPIERVLQKPHPIYHKPVVVKTTKRDYNQRQKTDNALNDDVPIKRIKIEKSELSKTKFPPINKFEATYESGSVSPFRKYYEDSNLSRQKSSLVEDDDNFSLKLLSLK